MRKARHIRNMNSPKLKDRTPQRIVCLKHLTLC
jgi:hypothetical protein